MSLSINDQYRSRVVEFQRRHRVGLVTLLFTDLVGSTKLKQELGDSTAIPLIQQHHSLVRQTLAQFAEGEEIDTAGDSFFLMFTKPSDAVRFALKLQAGNRELSAQAPKPVLDRVGIHVGEVFIDDAPEGIKPKDLLGLQVDTCARVMSLAEGDQVLMSRFAFDNARQVLRGQEMMGPLSWLNHGPYVLKGVEEPLEVCEVGDTGSAALKPPADTEKAHRHVSADGEPVLGWRPALDQKVPGTQWVLVEKLGEGGFGEVWLGRHETLKEKRVFKFCFRADRVRALKREMTLFRLLKERVGEHPNIVRMHDVYLDEAPFYLVMEYVEGRDLSTWWARQDREMPLEQRLDLVAQVADGLQVAHEAGIIHRDIKPSNILVSGEWRESTPDSSPTTRHLPLVGKLTDFGIGQVMHKELLAGVTLQGFTQTVLGSGSSNTGTLMYMAPELTAGKPASIRARHQTQLPWSRILCRRRSRVLRLPKRS